MTSHKIIKKSQEHTHDSYPKRGEILHVNLPHLKQSMRTLEPPRTSDISVMNIGYSLYEGLMRPREDGSVELGQAESLEIDAAKRIYRFHLKKNGWSDGTPVTAQHFENTWKQIILGKIDCPNVFLFEYIKNVKAVREGRADIDEVGIRSLRDDILEIELEKPISFFLELLGSNFCLPLHPVSIEGFLPDPNSTSYPLISNGPFKLTHWIPNVELIFEKNNFFHRADDVRLRKIHFNYINSEIATIDRFLDHSMDLLGRPFPCLIKHKAMRYLFQKGHFQLNPLASTTCVVLNFNRFPLNHPKLRQALYHSIDRTSLVNRLAMFDGGAATNLLPPVFSPENANPKTSTKNEMLDARRMFKQVLEEIGLQPKDLKEHLSILYPHNEFYFNLAMDLKEAWEFLFDMEIRTEQLVLSDIKRKLVERQFSIALITWYPDFYHPIALLNRFRNPDNSKNYSGWYNQRFSELIEEAENAATREESYRLCLEAEKILLHEVPIIPLLHGRYPVMTQAYVKNFSISPIGIINFDKIYLDENYKPEQNPLYGERDKIVDLLQECIKPPFEYPIPVTDLLMR